MSRDGINISGVVIVAQIITINDIIMIIMTSSCQYVVCLSLVRKPLLFRLTGFFSLFFFCMHGAPREDFENGQ